LLFTVQTQRSPALATTDKIWVEGQSYGTWGLFASNTTTCQTSNFLLLS